MRIATLPYRSTGERPELLPLVEVQVLGPLGRERVSCVLTLTIEQERAPAFRLVGRIKDTLQHDPTLSDWERQDLLSDVQMIEQQLKKREPNRGALAALLDPLSRVASIGGFVADLVRLLNP